jgi:hypothetical protein
MSIQEIPSVNEALSEYFRLKTKFDNENNVYKKRIINNQTLSKKEKRAEYLKLMPKCVNCKRPSRKGTIFSIVYHPSDDKTDAYRTFKCICGDLADPCNLNIDINIGKRDPLDKLMNNIRSEITECKNDIINDKNKLLFGLMTTETALENFDYNKGYINDLTSLYETYLDTWNREIDNKEKKIELDESLVQSYENMNAIKECIKKMNENNDSQYAIDAANIYYKVLKPLLDKIRQLKYSENSVYNNENNSTCNLIQRKYKIEDTLLTSYPDKIISFDVGLKAKVLKKKKPGLIIESEDESEKPEIVLKDSLQIKKDEVIPPDEPIIGQGNDGIAWNNSKYQQLWDKLPPKMKTEFKVNIDWMKDFMHKCVNDRNKEFGKGCTLSTPPNLIIPPKKMDNGQYDFGVSIYNKTFNSQPKTLQNTYLTLYKEDPVSKEKDYKMLENALNQLVEKEVDFRAFF